MYITIYLTVPARTFKTSLIFTQTPNLLVSLSFTKEKIRKLFKCNKKTFHTLFYRDQVY